MFDSRINNRSIINFNLFYIMTIAIITPNERDFRMHVLQQTQTEKNIQYIQVKDLNSAYGITINDYVSITNSVKMHNYNSVVEAVQKRIR